MSALAHNFPPYSLPRLYGWHMIPKQEIKSKGKIFQYFGANWWDLLLTGKLPLSKTEITVKTKDAHAIIFINLGMDEVMMMNRLTGDVYNIQPGKRSTVNNTFNKTITLQSSKPKTEIYLCKIGSIWLILLQIEQVRDGKALIKNSDLFTDFLLMSGVPDKDQYLTTLGIENFDAVVAKDWKLEETITDMRSDFAEGLLEQWKKVNPGKKNNAKTPVPRIVQWIWLRRDIRKQEFGALKPVFYKFMSTWIERNPKFTFQIWTDNPNFEVPSKFQKVITIKGPDDIEDLLNKLSSKIRNKIKYLYKNHENVGARSDTLRQAILYVQGGVYADINDAVCLAPFSKMLKKFDYIIGIEPVIYVNNAIIASKPKHIISQSMLTWLATNAKEFVREWKADYRDAEQDDKDDYIVSTTGPIAMSSVLFGVMKKHKAKMSHSLVAPSAWIYPNYWIADSPGVWLKPISIAGHYDRRDYLK